MWPNTRCGISGKYVVATANLPISSCQTEKFLIAAHTIYSDFTCGSKIKDIIHYLIYHMVSTRCKLRASKPNTACHNARYEYSTIYSRIQMTIWIGSCDSLILNLIFRFRFFSSYCCRRGSYPVFGWYPIVAVLGTYTCLVLLFVLALRWNSDSRL